MTSEKKDIAAILWWKTPENVTVELFNNSLTDNGFGDFITKVSSRKAFSKATGKLKNRKKDTLVRKVKGEVSEEVYQVTRETLETDDSLSYDKEATIKVDFKTDIIKVEGSEDLETTLQAEYNRSKVNITSSDISKILCYIFEKDTDLFTVKNRTGVYLIPKNSSSQDILDSVDALLSDVGGTLFRLDVKDDKNGIKVLKETISKGIKGLCDDFAKNISELKPGTRKSTIEELAATLTTINLKIEGYQDILQDNVDALKAKVKENKDALRKVITDMTSDTMSVLED